MAGHRVRGNGGQLIREGEGERAEEERRERGRRDGDSGFVRVIRGALQQGERWGAVGGGCVGNECLAAKGLRRAVGGGWG